MHDQLDELLAARDQMEPLLELITEIGSDFDLDATLQRIVTAATGLTGARYGALGVRRADGRLASFMYAGMAPDVVARMGQLPAGKGLLGLLLERTEALRLDDLTAHPATLGFPEYHPPMRAFLGMPIIVRGVVFGSLYLGDDRPGRLFAESDENAARALASAAAVAIDNAQLFERVATSARWTAASRAVSTALLTGAKPRGGPLWLIADRVRELTGAEQAIVLVPSDPDLPADEVEALVVSAAVGGHVDEVLGQRVPVDGSTTGEVFRSGAAVITETFRHPIAGFTDVGQRPAIVMPLHAGDVVQGVIAVMRDQYQPRFAPGLLDLVGDFAGHAALALTLNAGRAREQELTVLADRERIAHDLHDHVIQKLFATGMDLQSTIARARSPEVVDRLSRTVDDLQSTIDDIRAAIFRLNSSGHSGDDFRRSIQQVIAGLTDDREIVTTVRMSGPMNIIAAELAEHAEAILTEAISNTVRHSGATRLTVNVNASDNLAIDVIDNGRGIPADNKRRSGLANMERRVQQLGGTCRITTPEQGGTHVHFTAPLTGL